MPVSQGKLLACFFCAPEGAITEQLTGIHQHAEIISRHGKAVRLNYPFFEKRL